MSCGSYGVRFCVRSIYVLVDFFTNPGYSKNIVTSNGVLVLGVLIFKDLSCFRVQKSMSKTGPHRNLY